MTQPQSAQASHTMPAVQVAARDASGNTVTGFTGLITIAIGTNSGGGTLSGTTSVNASSGLATFGTLSINNPTIGYTLTASSSGLTGATSTAFNITPPLEGTIAFTGDSEGIYVVNADGSGVRVLAKGVGNNGNNYDPAWSPDGHRIAFTSTRDDPFYDVWVMNADGSGITRLTDSRPWVGVASGGWSGGAAWCGDRIAFYSARGGNNEIYLMNADGTAVVQLTIAAGSYFMPTWSPACDRIAFESHRDGNSEIHVINVDGTGETRLTDSGASNKDPEWSPDGNQIAFTSTRDGDGEIYVMNVDGSGVARLTHDVAADRGPAWSPDGKHIAFTSARDGMIYVMNRDGTDLIRLTVRVGFGRPAWRP